MAPTNLLTLLGSVQPPGVFEYLTGYLTALEERVKALEPPAIIAAVEPQVEEKPNG